MRHDPESEESDLADRACVPCRGGVPPLTADRAARLAVSVPNWGIRDNHHLERTFDFPDFAQALAFANRLGEIAEAAGHHPEMHLGWGKLRVLIWTHKVDGLTESDFILAARFDRVAS